MASAQFQKDFLHEYHIIEITSALITRAMSLAEARALRGYDAIQLAAALEVHDRCLTLGIAAMAFVSADSNLNAAADAEGLLVYDPNGI